MLQWRNGSRVRFKIGCLRACGFDSHLEYQLHGDVVQRQETTRLGRVQCGFESLHPHHAGVVKE
jgi:hypothetical protein